MVGTRSLTLWLFGECSENVESSNQRVSRCKKGAKSTLKTKKNNKEEVHASLTTY
jgi:hypothetical protein